MKTNIQVLSTALISQPIIDAALKQGVDIEVLPFIKTEPVKDKDLSEEITDLCKLRLTAVFTSANALNALAGMLKKYSPDWDVYCIGHATKEAVLGYFDASLIKGMADSAEALAGIIDANGVKEVIFFCGDKRLDALPDKLYKSNIMVREIVVYKSVETPAVVGKHYQGVLFFSPSGVHSYFSVNEPGVHAVLFAIGSTTAGALKTKTNNTVVLSDAPTREQMVNKVVQYFRNQAPFTNGAAT